MCEYLPFISVTCDDIIKERKSPILSQINPGM